MRKLNKLIPDLIVGITISLLPFIHPLLALAALCLLLVIYFQKKE